MGAPTANFLYACITMGEPNTAEEAQENQEIEPTNWADFLSNHPPGHGNPAPVSNVCFYVSHTGHLKLPEFELNCDSERCKGKKQFFKETGAGSDDKKMYHGWHSFLLRYQCRNCGDSEKRYWVAVEPQEDESGLAIKMGEHPPFRPHIPRRLQNMFEDVRDLFVNARSDEAQGKGIGAFAYYRRILEYHKDKLFDEIIKVAKNEARTDVVGMLKEAKKEQQFERAVKSVEAVIPKSIFIHKQNPLVLLSRALGRGIHAKTDEECLQLATQIRLVLTELVENIDAALKDEKELKQAVTDLVAGAA